MGQHQKINASPPASASSSTGSLLPVAMSAEEVASPPVSTTDDGAAGDASAASADERERAVEQLAQTYGATDAEVDGLVRGFSPKAIVVAARRCGTVRVCDEAAHFAQTARAFYRRGGAPVAAVRMGEVVVRVMVTCAARAAVEHRQNACARIDRRKAAPCDEKAQADALKHARTGVGQLAASLRHVCAGDAPALERVRIAANPGSVGHEDAGPGRALHSLVSLGRELLADPQNAPRCAAWGLQGSWLDTLALTAATAQDAFAAREAPALEAVDTAAEQRWRGLAMTLMRQMMGAFAAGHAANVAVPTLQPRFTRNALKRKPAATKGADAKPGDAKPAAAKRSAAKRAVEKPAAPAAPPAPPASPAVPDADAKPAPTA
jgi:hypothetical protein